MKFMHLTKKKMVALGLTFGVALGAGGIAAAYFSGHGSTTGSATVGTPQTFTVSQTGSGAPLYPTSSTTLTFGVYNPASFSEHFSGATATLASATTSGKTVIVTKGSGLPVPDCLATWFVVGTPSPITGTVPGHTTVTITVHVTMVTSGSTQNACGGASPKVTVSV